MDWASADFECGTGRLSVAEVSEEHVIRAARDGWQTFRGCRWAVSLRATGIFGRMESHVITALAVTLLSLSACHEPSASGPAPMLRERLAGAWQRVDGPSVLHFDGDRCVFADDGRQVLFAVTYGDDGIRRRPLADEVVLEERVAFSEGGMTLTYPGGRVVAYRRLAAVPDDARADALELGARQPAAGEIERLSAELRERTERDQQIRNELAEVMRSPQGRDPQSTATQAVMQRMRKIDVPNTQWLVGIVRDVGWIDRVRFPDRACSDAFLLVQHSGNLRLMQAVLPLIEGELRTRPEVGEEFALLYDRTQLELGNPQRYGTQLRGDSAGVMHVRRLEVPDRVDERRRSVGLGPHADYLEHFRKDGAQVVVDR